MRLSELKVGDKAEVTAVKAESAVRRRIMDLGLIKGTRFKVLRVAPFGGGECGLVEFPWFRRP